MLKTILTIGFLVGFVALVLPTQVAAQTPPTVSVSHSPDPVPEGGIVTFTTTCVPREGTLVACDIDVDEDNDGTFENHTRCDFASTCSTTGGPYLENDTISYRGVVVDSNFFIVQSPAGSFTVQAPLCLTPSLSPNVCAPSVEACLSQSGSPVAGTCPGTGEVCCTSSAGTAPPPGPATVNVSADPLFITIEGSSTLSWTSTNATDCVASGDWSGSKLISGKEVVSLLQTSTYRLTCTGQGGSGSDSVTITVTSPTFLPAPTVQISANPVSITSGNSSTLSWTASDGVSSCTASGAWEGFKVLSGSEPVSPPTTSTYTLTCTGQGGSGSDSVTITVTSPSQTSDTETASQNISAGGTVTTDTEGDNTTVSDPIETSLTSPVGGQVTINELLTTRSAPPGFSFLAREVHLVAPPAPPGNPLIISFQLNISLIPAAANPNTIRVFKDRVLVAGCPGNPCVSNIAVSGGNVVITVRTSDASAWNFGFAQAQAAASTGLVPCGGFELDADGNRITMPLTSPVPAGWGKISNTEMAKLQPACQLCHIFVLVQNILNIFLFPFVPIIGALLLVIGGFLFFVGGASPAQVGRGRTIITATLIGIVIIYTSWLLVNTFLGFIGVSSFTGFFNDPATSQEEGWWQIDCPVAAASTSWTEATANVSWDDKTDHTSAVFNI